MKRSTIIVTTVGKDRPGIVAGISKVLYRHNANILKSRASILGGMFVMVMVVDVSNINTSLTRLLLELKNEGVKLGSGISVEDEKTYMEKKKIIAFDMDGTLVNMEIIDELAKLAGVGDEVRDITKKAMEGKMSFKEALAKRVSLLKGLPLSKLEKLKSKLELSPGAQDLIGELKKAGFVIAIITGGFDVFANYIAEKLGVKYVYANKLEVKDGVLTGRFKGNILSPEDKLKALMDVAKKEKVSLSKCIAIGDGANDILLLKKSGLGIGYKPKKIVKQHVNTLIENGDLKTATVFIGVSNSHIRTEISRFVKNRK
ncbi:MAG: phosphoserine phosphatase SerB [Candidatus Bathyarchaeota archaeon]|nr:phosphoserine phosphatase SerB [Candidatus Bathyarchaeota archaeon]